MIARFASVSSALFRQGSAARFLSLSSARQNLPESEPQADGFAAGGSPAGTVRAQQQTEKNNQAVLASGVQGTVKWFDQVKGFGFIERSDTKTDVFVHFNSIGTMSTGRTFKSLDDGEEVQFDVIQGKRGEEAIRITGPGGAPVRGSSRQQPIGGRMSMGGGAGRGSFSQGGYGAQQTQGYGGYQQQQGGFGAPQGQGGFGGFGGGQQQFGAGGFGGGYGGNFPGSGNGGYGGPQ